MYQLLSSAVQEAGETSQDFLVHLFDLKQKVLFASQETGSYLKYDLVQCMFLHSLLTGLQNDSIKMEIEPCPSDPQAVPTRCKLWKRGELGTSIPALFTMPY